MNIHQIVPRSDCTSFAKCGKHSLAYCRRYGASECGPCEIVRRKPRNRVVVDGVERKLCTRCGRALSGNLSNFAGGLIILVFKPFKVGDYIDGPGVSGTIKEIQIFHTILSTLDNRMIYVPNGSLSGNAVTNYSKQDKRRVEWVFGVEYGEDVKRVRAVLQRIINADSRILDTPAPLIVLGSLSASSVDITVRVWVKSADYWSVLYDINEIVYTTFNEEGIGFPFPQLTLHHAKD